jgi:hypothetical protein
VADIAPLKKQLAEHRLKTGKSISITSYIAKCFACAIENDKRIQSRRLGKSRLIAFDDVDLAFTMERDGKGKRLPFLRALAHRNVDSAQHCRAHPAY